MNGWIKLHRQFRDSPYYKEQNAKAVWIECLLRAAHEDGAMFLKRQKLSLHSGQFCMGREEFGQSIGISGSTAWYWLLQFEADSMVDIKKTSTGSIVTVKKWHEYQVVDSEVDNRKTAEKQQKNTNKKDKNVKNDKNKHTSTKYGNISINTVIREMEGNFGTLDDSQKKNRQYASLLLKLVKKKKPDATEEESTEAVVQLIRAASQHNWWKSRIHKVETLYRNANSIASAVKEQHSQVVFIS